VIAQTAPGLAQAVISAVLLVGMLLLYLRRFAAPRRWVAVAVAVCAVDQAAKFVLPLVLKQHRPTLLGGYLRLSYTENREQGFGGTFSYLLLITAVCVSAMFFLYAKLSKTSYRMSTLAELGCALMIGGYLGILLDRVRLGFVVDFLEFGRASAFVYNLADLAVFLAVALLAARALQCLAEIKARRLRLHDKVLV
jgi:signal peptidase II